MVSRILREISGDLERLTVYLSKTGGGVKAVAGLLGIVLLGLGVYASWDFLRKPTGFELTYGSILAFAVLFALDSYLTWVTIRAWRPEPELEVGELTPDTSSNANMFQIKVRNLGPGKAKPTVTITHLRNANGQHLPGITESYRPREVHWRAAPEENWNPELNKGESAHAGVLYVEGVDSNCPRLCTYPNDLYAAFPLWQQHALLEDQIGIELTVRTSYRSSKNVKFIEHSYRIIPDGDKRLRYRIERVQGALLGA